MYYCKSRYYVPESGRWLNADSHNNLILYGATLINLYSYCRNNSINFNDLNGCLSFGDVWNGIKNIFADTIGVFIETTKNIVTNSIDYLFVGYETCVNVNALVGNDNKLISFYIKSSFEWWKFWEIGVKVNIGKFHASAGIKLTGIKASVGFNSSSFNLTVWIDKIGIGTSYESNRVESYNQYYINTIQTALAIAGLIAVIVYVLQIIPIAVTLVAFVSNKL